MDFHAVGNGGSIYMNSLFLKKFIQIWHTAVFFRSVAELYALSLLILGQQGLGFMKGLKSKI